MNVVWVLLVIFGTIDKETGQDIKMGTFREEFTTVQECQDAKKNILDSVPATYTIREDSNFINDRVVIYQSAACMKETRPASMSLKKEKK